MTGHKVEYRVSLDNITIVGVPKYKTSEIRSMLISKGVINNFWQTPYKRFNDNYTLLGGGLVQLTHDKGFVDPHTKFTEHQIRLEFNPNKVRQYEKLIGEYLDILKLIQEPKITRKDIAIDLVGEDLAQWDIYDNASRKTNEYKSGAGRLETIYFGSPKSDERIRIYDKALEQGLKDELIWWRVEAQLRKERAEMMKYNPFGKIVIAYNQDYEKYDIKTRAMLTYLRNHPKSMNELGKEAKAKYKKLLREHTEYMYIDIEGMMNEQKEELQTELESWLNFAPADVKEGFKVTPLRTCLSLLPDVFTDEQREAMVRRIEEWHEANFEDESE